MRLRPPSQRDEVADADARGDGDDERVARDLRASGAAASRMFCGFTARTRRRPWRARAPAPRWRARDARCARRSRAAASGSTTMSSPGCAAPFATRPADDGARHVAAADEGDLHAATSRLRSPKIAVPMRTIVAPFRQRGFEVLRHAHRERVERESGGVQIRRERAAQPRELARVAPKPRPWGSPCPSVRAA